jgi:hypothetical protein
MDDSQVTQILYLTRYHSDSWLSLHHWKMMMMKSWNKYGTSQLTAMPLKIAAQRRCLLTKKSDPLATSPL